MNDEDKIQSIQAKIQRENALINAANAMRAQTTNEAVRSRLDSQIRDARRNVQFFQDKLMELEARRGVENMSLSSPSRPLSSDHNLPSPPPKDSSWPPGDRSATAGQDYSTSPSSNQAQPKARQNFSKLDIIKYDNPYLGPRIQMMLGQLQFKLYVEEQYLKGVEKMVQLYSMDGDRKSRADAAARRVESKQKMILLKQAFKRYEELNIDSEAADAHDDESINATNMRKPLSGQLSIKVMAVRDVTHTTTARFSRGPETFVAVKIEDSVVVRTRSSRNDRWEAEHHVVDIDNANEVELTVYDKSGEYPMPIAMLWVRLSDIVEEMRRKRNEAELYNAGWVSADRMGQHNNQPPSQFPMDSQGQFNTSSSMGSLVGGPHGGPGQNTSGQPQPQIANQPITDWFILEPSGEIQLELSFVKQNRRPADFAGLGRRAAVRQRKEEVHEMHGHKFVQQNFYSVMRCALCGDYVKYSTGMQCEDCKYFCHTKCYTNVVTKCISKSNAETDPDEEKINHRIPHRFQPFSNMTGAWCCHCGYILPFGSKKNSRRCAECGLYCHAQCQHLVPDFCGMSMAVANQILDSIRTQKKKTSVIGEKTHRPSQSTDLRSSSSSAYGLASPQSPQLQKRPVSNTVPSSSSAASLTSIGQQQQRPQQGYAGYPGGADPEYSAQTPDDTYSQYGGSHQHQHQHQQHQHQQLPVQQPTQAKYNPADYANIDAYGNRPAPQQQHHQQQQQQQHHPMHAPSQQHLPQISQQVPLIQPHQQPSPDMSSGYGNQPLQQQMVKPEHQHGAISPSAVAGASGIPVHQRKPLPSATDPGTGQRIGLDHFNFLAVLGKGNFGKVMLAETKRSKRLYAIKVLKKEFIIENDEVESIRSEKRVFLIANRERHPFLTNLHACFQTETRVYFVMEYVSGGDLMLHIQRTQFGTKRAQFYAAEVCLALKYFHENGVIYRDLKLDNILLSLDGHVKIADYGLCKEDMWYGSTTSTFCGTPEFMAPEILLDKKYGRAVDWWAFGVLIYQMLLQQSPFRGEDEDEIYDAILSDEPLYPVQMPRDSVSILQKLLTREPDQRLGSGPTDAQEIMSQPFFRSINWDDIYHKRVPPPFIPQIKSATDTSNFDSEFTSVTPVLTPVQSVLSQAMQEEFRGFSYTADFD
ncbi:Serine/threonine kinase [Ceratocystis pirilliformis]|uniref:protein kinase C n=1 Tax=Ceratocystis pirilliformis TaxID=259994 RepID=A0ABR3ZJA3_9PEZI